MIFSKHPWSLALLGLLLIACGPSEEDRAHAEERAALTGQQNAIFASMASGSGGCMAALGAAREWEDAHRAEIEASDAWWGGLGDGVQGTLYGDHDEFHQSAEHRIRVMIMCGSAGELWDPGA